MQFQRVSRTQLLIFGPLDAVREASWYALWNSGAGLPTIDPVKNVVSGSQGDGFLTASRVATASFESVPEGTLVSFQSKPVLGGTIDLGTNRKKSEKMLGALERLLQQGYAPETVGQRMSPTASAAAPIASPTGAAPVSTAAMPRYGPVLAPKRGVTLLVYSILSLFICGVILAPMTIIYGFGALKDYKRQGDPGDKTLVIVSMVLATLILLLNVAVLAVTTGIFDSSGSGPVSVPIPTPVSIH